MDDVIVIIGATDEDADWIMTPKQRKAEQKIIEDARKNKGILAKEVDAHDDADHGPSQHGV